MNKDQILDSFFFRPERGFFITPDRLGLEYEDVIFRAPDGTGLHGWFIPTRPSSESSDPETAERARHKPVTIIFMHGTGGNISHRAENAAALNSRLGANVFLFDYRGYGRSSGEPTEDGTYLDAEAAFETICRRPDVDSSRIMLFGHSLGGAVAIELARNLGSRIYGLVVESSFTTGKDVAKLLLPIVPDNAVPDFYNSLSKIGQVEAPVLITHAEKDSLLPPAMGKALYAAANDPKTFYLVPKADHADIYQVGGKEYFQQIQDFVARCSGV